LSSSIADPLPLSPSRSSHPMNCNDVNCGYQRRCSRRTPHPHCRRSAPRHRNDRAEEDPVHQVEEGVVQAVLGAGAIASVLLLLLHHRLLRRICHHQCGTVTSFRCCRSHQVHHDRQRDRRCRQSIRCDGRNETAAAERAEVAAVAAAVAEVAAAVGRTAFLVAAAPIGRTMTTTLMVIAVTKPVLVGRRWRSR